jgi:uncharacterized protein YegL
MWASDCGFKLTFMDQSVELKAKVLGTQRDLAPQDIIVVGDSSSSVKDHDFGKLIQAVQLIITGYGENTRVAFMLYDSKVSLESGLDYNKTAVLQRVSDAAKRKLRGGTNTGLALSECASLLLKSNGKSSNRIGAKMYIILITDGNAQDQALAKTQAKKLKAADVQIFGIAIGNANTTKLAEISTRVFKIDNFTGLLDSIPRAAPAVPTVLDSEIEISVRFGKVGHSLKNLEKINVHIALSNISPIKIPAGSLIVIDGGNYFQKHVHEISSDVLLGDPNPYNASIMLAMRASISIATLPEKIDIYVKERFGPKRFNCPTNQGFLLEPRMFARDILTWKPSQSIQSPNLLLFGWIGCGKSTLLNNLLSLFLDNYCFFAQAANVQSGHVTTKVSSYNWNHNALREACGTALGINILDTFGLTEHSYTPNIFRHLLKGILPSDWVYNDNRDVDSLTMNIPPGHKSATEAHAILLVLPQGLRLENSSMNLVKKYFNFMITAGYNPLLAITFMDTEDTNNWEVVRAEFATKIGMDRADIFLIDNTDSGRKTFSRDQIMLGMLDCVQRRIQDFLNARESQQNTHMPSVNPSTYYTPPPSPGATPHAYYSQSSPTPAETPVYYCPPSPNYGNSSPPSHGFAMPQMPCTPPPPPPTPKPKVVQYPYSASSTGELSIHFGETIYVYLEQNGWALCRKPTSGEMGYVPVLYLQ